MTTKIYHNPDCGTSRNVLAVLEAAEAAPEVIEYLKVGWQRAPLLKLMSDAGLSVRAALRETKSPAKEMGLLEPGIADDVILEAMLAHPVLVNRPFVVTPKGTRLCRPSELVLDLLDRLPPGPFAKEDDSLMIDADGHRVI